MSSREIQLGNPAMKSVAIQVQRFDAGFVSPNHRSTANAVFTVLEGAGTTTVGDRVLKWERGDVFVVPCWQLYHHEISTAAHLVRVSDEPLMRALDLLRLATPSH
jgi:gentisate 1,2-dioxygenase